MIAHKTRSRLRLTLAALALGWCGTSTFAQVGEYRNTLAIGVNGGYALNKVNFDRTIKQAFHGGMTGGMTVRYTSEKYFGIYCAVQAEVNFTQLGWKEVIETSPDTYQRDINYVQVPLLAHLAFGKEHRGVQGFINLGPQLDFYVSDKEKRNEWLPGTPQRPNRVIEQYGLPVQKKFQYGITGGAGMEINTAAGHFIVEGRYCFGLSDIFNNGKSDPFGRSANGAIVAKVSYLFDVIKTKK